MRLLFFLLIFTGLPISAQAASSALVCLKQLPEKLQQKAPDSFQFARVSKDVKNYEEELGGAGWGYSVKYQNNYCEVMIYLYTHLKTGITSSDIETEMTEFDGFKHTNSVQKEIDNFSFSFAQGTTQFEKNADKQFQLLALTSAQNHFLKYRASCRQINGLSEQENFHLAESFLTTVIQKSLKKITFCLFQQNLSDKNN